MIMSDTFDVFRPPNVDRDNHAVISLTLFELETDGVVDYDSDAFDFDAYDDEQRNRLWTKFSARYAFREIGIIPYARWHKRLIGKLNEIMPKYKWAYDYVKDGYAPLATESRFNKSRSIDSDFPQTLLTGNEDYASFGRDFEHEEIVQGDFLEKLAQLRVSSDIDILILDELECLFSNLVTVNMNSF